jgi:signal transduction histidine kinase
MAEHILPPDRTEHLLFMLARVTHELRTPLNAVVGFADLMRAEAYRSSAAHDLYLGHLQQAARHLSALVSDLADLPALHRGSLSLADETVSVGDAARQAVAMVECAARRSGMAVRCHGGPFSLAVRADGLRVVQVLLNLLSNAVKYGRGTPNEVEVSWRCEASAGRACIAVRDHGAGLEPAQLGALFEPFSRLGAERTGPQGSGLGLFISRGLARAMGGDIEVDSLRGRGTTFTLLLPLAEETVS